MHRIALLIVPALVFLGCSKGKNAQPATRVPDTTSASAAKTIPQQNQEFLQKAAKEPGAQVFHVSSARGAGDIVLQQLQPGNGPSPKATDSVTVNYTGTLPNGSVFDASANHGGAATFPLNRVIPCWTEGLQHMKVGEKAKITCSPETAYGAEGRPPVIPSNSPLTFQVELLKING